MSRSECEKADWAELGHQDAAGGEDVDGLFKRRQKDCAERGIRADSKEYALGFEKGVKTLCTYEGGLNFGFSGSASSSQNTNYFNTYKNQCPSELEAEFLKGYRAGRAERERDILKAALDGKEEENRRLRTELNESKCTTVQ